jgi:large subunit ribosomal protein L34
MNLNTLYYYKTFVKLPSFNDPYWCKPGGGVRIFDLLLNIGYIYAMSQTYQPKTRKRHKTHGFLARTKTKTGQNVLKRRRQKGRAKLTV